MLLALLRLLGLWNVNPFAVLASFVTGVRDDSDTTATELQVVESIFKLQEGRPGSVATDMRNALIDQLA